LHVGETGVGKGVAQSSDSELVVAVVLSAAEMHWAAGDERGS
jgi:hypothetical protein